MKKINISFTAVGFVALALSVLSLNALTNSTTTAKKPTVPSCSSSNTAQNSITNKTDIKKIKFEYLDQNKQNAVSYLQITKEAEKEINENQKNTDKKLFLYIFIKSYG